MTEGVSDKGDFVSLPYNKSLISRAKELPKTMTRQEKHLWYDYLSKYPVRFQRQKVIEGFIVDFYCHNAKLVVELDGSQHYDESGMEYDAERTGILEKHGLLVIRFPNLDVDRNFEGVCKAIDILVKNRIALRL